MKPIVCSNKFCTSGVAALNPKTFNIPNQKNITNSPNRESGIEIFLKNVIARISKEQISSFESGKNFFSVTFVETFRTELDFFFFMQEKLVVFQFFFVVVFVDGNH